MTKTKYWLSLLAISVVLVAGSLAVSPIAIAEDDDDDDDDDFDEIIVQETYNLAGLPAATAIGTGAVIVVDTTPVVMKGAHIAAVLPTTDISPFDNCGTEDSPQLVIVAGSAPSVGGVISGANIVTPLGPRPADFAGEDDLCVYHRTITAADTPASAITDIAVLNPTSSAAPDGSSITVTGFRD